ncbi:hypothetical protein VA249_46060 (plasmid) [Vibrio alfacsensis]|uniref:hypothetical protein n=1 Tax=Vibrio alfacsensis TaxID=1074311 RepID=UPI001BEE073A|nr:hypothetical protein [Vibrio alfacsensis]BBM67960.1 hypothetical protein VA249_46060 [Vibrio alfacsensis]
MIQKSGNLEPRLEQWNKERRDWLRHEVPMTLLIGIIVCGGMFFLVSDAEASSKPPLFFWIIAFFGLAIPPLRMSYPKKPSQADVDADVDLLKAFNKNETTSDKQD